MVLKLCLWRSYNLLPTFGTFHELENSLRMPINGLGNLMGSLGGPRKPTWRWNLKFFFHGINFYYKRGYFCEKRGCKSSKTKKFFFFAQIPHAFIQCNATNKTINWTPQSLLSTLIRKPRGNITNCETKVI